MPFAFIIVGLVLVVAGARNTQGELLTLVEGDLLGPHNFVYWMLSILAVGSVGYIKPLKPIANSFLVLIIIMLFISDKGFFAQFTSALSQGASITAQPIGPATSGGVVFDTGAATQQKSSGGIMGGIGSLIGGVLGSFL